MEIKPVQKTLNWLSNLFFVTHAGTSKRELRISNLKWVMGAAVVLFVTVVLFLPDESPLEFSHKDAGAARASSDAAAGGAANSGSSPSSAGALWSAPRLSFGGGSSDANHNTSMIVGQKGGNAKTQLRSGQRLPIRILDKFVVSQDQVPILAELILDTVTDSGLKLPAGTRFYGEASFQRGADRASISFKQISLPSGQIREISAIAIGKDGQPGISGRVRSDGAKNTAGQLLTTFVGAMAQGSIQTDFMGKSRGGLQNGALNAVSQTAQTRAQMYGEKLKTEREWIEVSAGSEADALLSGPLNLQEGGGGYE